jgi:hypothetical protein
MDIKEEDTPSTSSQFFYFFHFLYTCPRLTIKYSSFPMPKETTPSFITELPLQVGTKEQAVLKRRFFAAKQQYNALLGETLKRFNRMKADSRFQKAKNLYKEGKKGESKKLFRLLEKEYGYREYDLYGYTKQWNKKGSSLSIGARVSQQIAKRVFSAVEAYRFGKRGKPRFKGRRGLQSIEDNSIDANIRLKERVINYLKINLPLQANPDDAVHRRGLNSRVKYIRLVKRNFNGRTRYFAQLVCEGKPFVRDKNTGTEGTVGLDVGPSTIAMVSAEKGAATIRVFADELKDVRSQKKVLQRKLARQFRINNPHAYEEDRWVCKDKKWKCKRGKNIRGKGYNKLTQATKKTIHKLSDIQRKQASHRKSQHGKMANAILRIGTTIKTEKLSYKAFQKLFGRSVGLRAPGRFLQHLKRKAENAGGKVEEFSTYSTKLSQTCHCGKVEKKHLSKRWHQCDCGVIAQRDLYSAFLACFVKNNALVASQAQKVWEEMDIVLRTAMSECKQASSGPLPASLGLRSGSEPVVCDVS